jgi:hypothetical protein
LEKVKQLFTQHGFTATPAVMLGNKRKKEDEYNKKKAGVQRQVVPENLNL